MKLTCAALAGLLWAGAAVAAGPAPAPEENAEAFVWEEFSPRKTHKFLFGSSLYLCVCISHITLHTL